MNTNEEIRTKLTKEASDILLGRTIKHVRYMTPEEMEWIGWWKCPVVMILDNGTIIYPSTDDEGNDGGAIHYSTKDGNGSCIPVL